MSDSPCLRTWKGGCAASHAHPATKERRRGGVRSLATVGRAFECLSSLYWPSLPPNADNYSLLLWAMVVGGLRMARNRCPGERMGGMYATGPTLDQKTNRLRHIRALPRANTSSSGAPAVLQPLL